MRKICIIAISIYGGKSTVFRNLNWKGGLAHLARALDWQSKGGRFDPDILHKMGYSFL